MKNTGSTKQLELRLGDTNLQITTQTDWLTLYKDNTPEARMFYIWYKGEKIGSGDPGKKRPLTFVFNGGPGASSVYLHLGALGPRTIELTDEGYPLPPPNRLVNNPETWLNFTDLVFVDPIGTGLSYAGPGVKRELGEPVEENQNPEKTSESKSDTKSVKEDGSGYYTIKEDLASLGQFISRFLTKCGQWENPVYVAGESYGGFRTAKMARTLQEDWGIPLTGAIMISPALEFGLLTGSDYDAPHFLDTFPSMAAAAAYHGRARNKRASESIPEFSQRAGVFALNELLPVLAGGKLIDPKISNRVLKTAADFTGMERRYLEKTGGRIPVGHFIKALLVDQELLVGIYDASYKQHDPFADRPVSEGPEPTLHVLERVFTSGINHHLRNNLGLETDRLYELISGDVFKNWKIDTQPHVLDLQVGATDDLRFGIALNRDTRYFICHGIYDLRTPWFSTERITSLMRLNEEAQKRLAIRYYDGGHMFYSWKHSRSAFFQDMKKFYAGEL